MSLLSPCTVEQCCLIHKACDTRSGPTSADLATEEGVPQGRVLVASAAVPLGCVLKVLPKHLAFMTMGLSTLQ